MRSNWHMGLLTGALALSALPGVGHAEIYRIVDTQGNITFTDTPAKGAQRMQLPPLAVVRGLTVDQIAQVNGLAVAGVTAVPRATVPVAGAVGYRINILAPKARQGFARPTDSIEIGAVTQPPLAGSDRMVILLNGKPLAEGNSAAVPTESLERGEQRVTVQVVAGNGRVLASDERVVMVHPVGSSHGRRP